MAHKRGYPTYDRFMHVIGLTAQVSLGDPLNTNNILDSADIKFKTSIKDSWFCLIRNYLSSSLVDTVFLGGKYLFITL